VRSHCHTRHKDAVERRGCNHDENSDSDHQSVCEYIGFSYDVESNANDVAVHSSSPSAIATTEDARRLGGYGGIVAAAAPPGGHTGGEEENLLLAYSDT